MVTVARVCEILPVSQIIVETASFDIQKIKNPEIQGVEYQRGEHGFLERARIRIIQGRTYLPVLQREKERPGTQCSSH